MRRRRTRGRRGEGGGRRQGPRLRWGRWLIATLIALPLAFGAGYAVAALVLFPSTVEEPTDLVPMPRLLGATRIDAEREVMELGLTVEEVSELPNPTAPRGAVTAQTPLPGQLLQPGAGVRIGVSSGPPQARVPDLAGLPYENAARVAEALGFTVNRLEGQLPGTPGLVHRVEPEPGTPRELPATITLIVVAQPIIPELELPEMGAEPDSPVEGG